MSWLDGELELEAAPWARPKWRRVAPGVEVLDIYGWHVLNALIWAGFKKVRRRMQVRDRG